MLFDPDFSDGVISADAYCFAGLEDDLVIGGSEDGDMFVWSLPNGRGRDCTINRSLQTFHNGNDGRVHCVCYSNDKSTIVSCGEDGVIKLWTSVAAG